MLAALDKLARALGMYTDKVDVITMGGDLATARTLGLMAELLDVRSEQDVRAAFDAALRLQVGALLLEIDGFT